MRNFTFMLFVFVPASLHAKTFVYISLDGENRIASYGVDEASGTLTNRSDTKLDAAPGSLAVSPTGHFLFASVRSSGHLASFRINAETGDLTHINTVPAGADPAFVATDRSGRFLLTAFYVAAKVTVHRIGQDGALSQEPVQSIATADKAHAILMDHQNRFAFVPHTGPNAIYQFTFDAHTGRLTPNRPLRVETGEHTGPRQLAFHPSRDLVFFDYEQGSAIAAFDLDQTTGRLSFRERLSSLPDSYSGGNSNARIEITPNGRFVYVANRGHDSLAGFSVDPHTGKLTSLGQTPTEATPRGFAIDPTGRFLYAAGQSTGKLAAFRIDADSGALTRFATYEVGERPWWVLVVVSGTDSVTQRR